MKTNTTLEVLIQDIQVTTGRNKSPRRSYLVHNTRDKIGEGVKIDKLDNVVDYCLKHFDGEESVSYFLSLSNEEYVQFWTLYNEKGGNI